MAAAYTRRRWVHIRQPRSDVRYSIPEDEASFARRDDALARARQLKALHPERTFSVLSPSGKVLLTLDGCRRPSGSLSTTSLLEAICS